jgi:maltose alpha-D-glucosyltransferase/alpha-amylase
MPAYPSWLERAVFYQIYPPSYQDSSSDGIGDLPGITSRLEHVKSLGCDALWISPVFLSRSLTAGTMSPTTADYYRVAPRYGTLEDLRRLIREAHRLGIRVCLDTVNGYAERDGSYVTNRFHCQPVLRTVTRAGIQTAHPVAARARSWPLVPGATPRWASGEISSPCMRNRAATRWCTCEAADTGTCWPA